MAAMGGGKMNGKLLNAQKPGAAQQPFVAPLIRNVNVVISVGEPAPVVERGIDLPVIGTPIMHEGFVTETDLLPRPIDG
jgi:hypothetical protein